MKRTTPTTNRKSMFAAIFMIEIVDYVSKQIQVISSLQISTRWLRKKLRY
jgi:hypothetical protein